MLELRVPPPVVGLVFGAAMWLVAEVSPSLSLVVPFRTAFCIALAAAGVAVGLLGICSFRRQRTTVNPLKPDAATALVTGGVYRVTRNPMYLGMALVLIGWAVFLGNALAPILVLGFMLYINRYQIEPEERVLATLFGTEFDAYRRRVRRWI